MLPSIQTHLSQSHTPSQSVTHSHSFPLTLTQSLTCVQYLPHAALNARHQERKHLINLACCGFVQERGERVCGLVSGWLTKRARSKHSWDPGAEGESMRVLKLWVALLCSEVRQTRTRYSLTHSLPRSFKSKFSLPLKFKCKFKPVSLTPQPPRAHAHHVSHKASVKPTHVIQHTNLLLLCIVVGDSWLVGWLFGRGSTHKGV